MGIKQEVVIDTKEAMEGNIMEASIIEAFIKVASTREASIMGIMVRRELEVVTNVA